MMHAQRKLSAHAVLAGDRYETVLSRAPILSQSRDRRGSLIRSR
jgi:hypothetical protein